MLFQECRKFIWVVGSPRSGTSFLTEYLGRHVDLCYNEPFKKFPLGKVGQWKFPDGQDVVFKYCVNWRHAPVLADKFRVSYFVHLVRRPQQVIYSMVFPKKDGWPYRNFDSSKKVEVRFGKSLNRWYENVVGGRAVVASHRCIEVKYEHLDTEVERLKKFLGLPLESDMGFKCRNGVGEDPHKHAVLEVLWHKPQYADHLNLRRAIESEYFPS